MLVVAVNERHAELATAYALSELFTFEFTNNLLVTHFVPDMRQGHLSGALVKFVAECQKQIKLQWWVKRTRTAGGKPGKHDIPFFKTI